MQEVLQNDEKFSNVDRETVEAINLFAGTDIDMDEKEEVIDMCKAWEDQKNEGRELGERQKIISLVVKKLQKDKSVAETTGASDAAIVDSGLTGAKLKGKNWTSITITYTPSNGSVSYTIAGGDDAYYKVDENDAGKFIKNEG